MASSLDTLVNTIPVILVGGMAMKMTEGMFGSIKTAQSSQSEWQPLTKKEVYNLIGTKKADMLRKNPSKVYTWGYDKFKFENGKFWLA